jgi:hypothetical protein
MMNTMHCSNGLFLPVYHQTWQALWSKPDPTHDGCPQRSWIFPEFPICTFVLFLIESVSKGVEAVWLPIAGKYAKTNLKFYS